MEGIRLDVRQFGWLNDNDSFMIFTKEINEYYNSLTKEEQLMAAMDTFVEEMNKHFYLTYKDLLVTPENSLYGYDGVSYHLIASDLEGIYDTAKQVK